MKVRSGLQMPEKSTLPPAVRGVGGRLLARDAGTIAPAAIERRRRSR